MVISGHRGLLDNLVGGGENRRRDIEADGFGGAQVDGEHLVELVEAGVEDPTSYSDHRFVRPE